MKAGSSPMTPTNTKIIKEYYKQHYVHKFYSLKQNGTIP